MRMSCRHAHVTRKQEYTIIYCRIGCVSLITDRPVEPANDSHIPRVCVRTRTVRLRILLLLLLLLLDVHKFQYENCVLISQYNQ